MINKYYKKNSKKLFNGPKYTNTQENIELIKNATTYNQLNPYCGVYAIYDNLNNLIYVGESDNIFRRLKSHMRKAKNIENVGKGSIFCRHVKDEIIRKKNISGNELLKTYNRFKNTIKFQFLLLDYGRKELEEYIIDNYRPTFNLKSVKIQ